MLRTIIVDDEKIILDELTELLINNRHIEVVGTYQNPLTALDEIQTVKPDCAFLDIEMTEMKGIEMAERLMSQCPRIEIIFVTAYNSYAAQAYDVNAIDYLLKPVKMERLDRTIEKLIKISPNITQESSCKICCFGTFEVFVAGQSVKWGRSKAKEFLAFMLQNEGKWVTKYRLCEELRPDDSPEQALTYLQMAIYTLRKNLKAAGCTQIEIRYSDDRYMVSVKDVDWDMKKFEEAMKDFKRTGNPENGRKAIECYRDEYLEGEDWLWADIQRESYRYEFESLQKKIGKSI